jgi:hypothetical protein
VALNKKASIALAHEWLKDPRPVFRAWGAVVVRQIETPFQPELIDALGNVDELRGLRRSYAGEAPDDDDRMRIAILDALIERRARLAPEMAMALLHRYPAQAVILLYRDGCPSVDISKRVIADSPGDEPWQIASNCLAGQAGGVAELLQTLRVIAEIKVFDPNRGEGMIGGVIGGLPGAAPPLMPPLGWPEMYTYRLAAGSDVSVGSVLLSPGRDSVFYQRAPGASVLWPHESRSSAQRSEYVLDLLAWRIGTNREALSIEARPKAQLHWTTADNYLSDLRAFASEQQRRFEDLLTRLIRSDLLTESERRHCQLMLEIEIVDHRSRPNAALPIGGLNEMLRDR